MIKQGWSSTVADKISDRLIDWHVNHNRRDKRTVLDLHDLHNGAIAGCHIITHCQDSDIDNVNTPGEMLPINSPVRTEARQGIQNIIASMVESGAGDKELLEKGVEVALRVAEEEWRTRTSEEDECFGCLLVDNFESKIGSLGDAIVHVVAEMSQANVMTDVVTDGAYTEGLVDALELVREVMPMLGIDTESLRSIEQHECKLCRYV